MNLKKGNANHAIPPALFCHVAGGLAARRVVQGDLVIVKGVPLGALASSLVWSTYTWPSSEFLYHIIQIPLCKKHSPPSRTCMLASSDCCYFFQMNRSPE